MRGGRGRGPDGQRTEGRKEEERGRGKGEQRRGRRPRGEGEGGGREPRLCPAVSPTEPRTTKNWPDFCEHLRKVRAYISHRFGEEVKSGEI